jgi:hypothetical protein
MNWQRIQRRLGAQLTAAELAALVALRSSVDMLDVRAMCVRAGFKLSRRRTWIAGVAKPFLVHERP